MIPTPTSAVAMASHVAPAMCSRSRSQPRIAAMNGDAARRNNVLATLVALTDKMKVTIDTAMPMPATTPATPMFRNVATADPRSRIASNANKATAAPIDR